MALRRGGAAVAIAGECAQYNSVATVDVGTGELRSCAPNGSHDICETE